MRVDISWWELRGSDQTIDLLRKDLEDGTADEWKGVPGLRLKLWISDRATNRWGAVMLWGSDQPAGLPPLPNRAAELIGRQADHRARFEVEAAVEGAHALGLLGDLDAVAARFGRQT